MSFLPRFSEFVNLIQNLFSINIKASKYLFLQLILCADNSLFAGNHLLYYIK